MPGRADLGWSKIKVGLTVGVAAAVLIIAIFAVTGQSSWFSHRLTLYTYVPDAGEMRTGANVNLEGVTIGNVSAIGLAEHPPDVTKPVLVTMRVTAGHERWLRKDSPVVLGTAGPLGETLVNISAGTLSSPPAADGTILQGQPSTDINQLLVSSHDVVTNANLLEQRIGQLLDQVQNGKGSIGQLLYSSQLYDSFNDVATNLKTMTANLNAGKGTAGKLLTSDDLGNKLNSTLDNLNGFINQAEHGPGTMAKLMNDPTLYNNLNQDLTSLHQTLAALNNGQGAVGALLTNSTASTHLRDSLTKLDDLLTGLQQGKGTVGKALQDQTLYNNLNQLTLETRDLIKAIRTDPKHYLTIHLNIF